MYDKKSSQFSLLNASSSSKSEEFKLKDIEMHVGKENQPWLKQAHLGIFLELPKTVNSIRNLDFCEMHS